MAVCGEYEDFYPEDFAKKVIGWIGDSGKVKRISLHVCMSGGNKRQGIEPRKSFAFKFASYLGNVAECVSARTDVVAGIAITRKKVDELSNPVMDALTKEQVIMTTVHRAVARWHQTEGDKFLFLTNPNSNLKTEIGPNIMAA